MTRRIDFEVPADAREDQCKACKAPIAWVRSGEHKDGRPKWMPLDLSSVQLDLNGARRALSHFAICPEAASFRRSRR